MMLALQFQVRPKHADKQMEKRECEDHWGTTAVFA
jgi:hypothetical protein